MITFHISNGVIQMEMDQLHSLNQLDVDQNLVFGSLQVRFSNPYSRMLRTGLHFVSGTRGRRSSDLKTNLRRWMV